MLVGDILTCIGFFTRIPVSGPSQRGLSAAIWAAPIAGAAVGIAGALAYGVATAVGLPPSVAAAAALGTAMLLTGSLHEDGLADVADGFGGGATRERKLDIMKDSRIGTYGVVALTMTILVRWSTLAALAHPWSVFWVLIAAHAASRALLPAFMLLVPPARNFGLSAGVGTIFAGVAATALLLGAVVLFPLGPLTAMTCITALGIWFAVLKALTERQIGGQTGDVLGALQQGGEIVVLLVALCFHP